MKQHTVELKWTRNNVCGQTEAQDLECILKAGTFSALFSQYLVQLAFRSPLNSEHTFINTDVV